MKKIGKTSSRDAQVYLNRFYDVVAQNGIVIGSVRYAFYNDEKWCIAIQLHSGMPAWGESEHEIESVFDLKEGDAPWAMPTVQPQSRTFDPPIQLGDGRLLLGYDLAKD